MEEGCVKRDGRKRIIAEGELWISKTLFCAAALAANVYRSKAQKRVARYRAVLKSATRLQVVIFFTLLL